MYEGKVGLVYGSDTGATEAVAHLLARQCPWDNMELCEVSQVNHRFFERNDVLILGASTWYTGDLQSDWQAYFPKFKTLDLSGKMVALYGLGDQFNYDDYFVDALGILARAVLDSGGELMGHWPTKGYCFSESQGLMECCQRFYGLALDEDNQPERTEERIAQWTAQLQTELRERTTISRPLAS
ncbi:flavodoxin [Maribacter sp. 2307ULW6-5]|uniref:flavodoxin n=1 Tax=Maribacter sp. 2307ULW6-5 TaxID=3386275 RepID=UPI0039BCB1C2